MQESKHIRVSAEVGEARASRQPIVALESTLITHGLPRPVNLETAVAMESEVRSAGAIPATVCLLDGVIRVGLSEAELSRLSGTRDALKVSRRDLANAIRTGRTAGATVSGTMWIAARTGIEFFGTGGIGGVHHGASETGDISADLPELAQAPVVVVSSGVKSILDIGRTLEYLETAGVPVAGYQTDEFPAFFSASSGFAAPSRVDSPEQAATVWRIHRELGMPSGMLVACPPPVAIEDAGALEGAITQANREAREQRIVGGAVTPFVLRRIGDLTDGASVRINIALLRRNARIAGEIAVASAMERCG